MVTRFPQTKHPRYSKSRRRRTPRGGRTLSSGPTPVRGKGPAPFLIILAVIVFLIMCWVFGRGCGGSKEAKEGEKLREYSARVNKIIDRSAAVASKFELLRKDAKDKARKDISDELGSMISDCRAMESDLSKVEVPEKAITLSSLLKLSFELRTEGIEKFREAILDVLDRKDLDASAARMSEGLMDLVVSDEAMERFRAALELKLKAAKLTFEKVADAVYVQKKDDALLASVRDYIAELTGEQAGTALHGVAIKSLLTTPASVDRTESGISILPYSDSFAVKVTVQNQGNQEEEDIPVVATLTSDEAAPQQKTQKIERLKAGESVTLVFENLKPVIGLDKENVLTVKAGPVPHEKRTDNNEQRFRFIMKPEGR